METPKHKPHVNIGQIICDGRGGFLGVLPKDYPSERELLQNALHQLEKLQADKAELLEALETVLHNSDVPNEIYDQSKALIQKHKQ